MCNAETILGIHKRVTLYSYVMYGREEICKVLSHGLIALTSYLYCFL